jgi:hypothetical protein
MMEARNQTVHTYDPTLAHALYPLIKDKFLPELVKSVQLLKPYISYKGCQSPIKLEKNLTRFSMANKTV